MSKALLQTPIAALLAASHASSTTKNQPCGAAPANKTCPAWRMQPAGESSVRAASSRCKSESRPTPARICDEGLALDEPTAARPPRMPRRFAPMTGPLANAFAQPSANSVGQIRPQPIRRIELPPIGSDSIRRKICSAKSNTRRRRPLPRYAPQSFANRSAHKSIARAAKSSPG